MERNDLEDQTACFQPFLEVSQKVNQSHVEEVRCLCCLEKLGVVSLNMQNLSEWGYGKATWYFCMTIKWCVLFTAGILVKGMDNQVPIHRGVRK